jgi:hypothetical protein
VVNAQSGARAQALQVPQPGRLGAEHEHAFVRGHSGNRVQGELRILDAIEHVDE